MTARLALLLLLFLFPGLSYAQRKHYDIINYNTDNGLPQNSITAIQFDRKGYCWLGTQMGLVRFDGQRFSLYGSDNTKGLRSDRIFNVTRDKAGNLFASTGGIVNILKIDDNPSLTAPVPVLLRQSAPEIPTRGFVTPLVHADTIKSHPAFEMSLGTPMGSMYFIRSTGSYYIKAQQKTQLPFKGPYERDRILLVDENLVVLGDRNEVSVWTGAAEQPAPQLRGPLWTDPDFKKGNFTTPVNAGGAYIYAGKTLYQLSLVRNKLCSEVVLEHIEIPAVSCIYVDKPNNRLYIGSGVSGLFIITPTEFYTPPVPLAGFYQGFYSQSVTEEGILSQRFLFRKDGTHKEYPLIPQMKATWYRPGTGNLYYAPDLSLLRFHLPTGKTHHLATFPTPVSSIFPDPGRKEDLIFSTSFAMGKIVDDTVTGLQKISGLRKGQELFACYPAGNDTFLLATWSGVKWYDYRHNRIYRSILDSLMVRQLYAEGSQRIWIASYGKGWYLYNMGRVIRMPDGPRDALKTVNAIIDDGRGYFWLSSNNGLFKVSRQALIDYAEHRAEEVYFYAFTTQDHLPTNEFNASNPSYVWLPDSMLSLPSLKGLVWFYPHKTPVFLPDKSIYIEYIRLNETVIEPTDGNLSLPPDHGRLSLKVSSPYFGNKENMQLQFKIEGLDDDWHDVPESGEIIIDRLPAGTFALIVKKITGMEPGQYIHVRLPIQVRPYWYHTRLFYLLLLFLLIVFVYWLVKLRTRLLQVRNRKLEMQVALQTRDLNRVIRQLIHSEDALKQSNQTKDNIITTVLHDLRSPIRFIYTISRHIASDHRTMQQDALDMYLQELRSSTASLNNFTDQFFTWALSQHRSFSAKYSREALAAIFQETETLYADIMSANGNKLIVASPALYCYTDPQLLSIIIRNLLDNANKYTSKGVIKLAATLSDDNVIITISDTGKGFKPEALSAFLDKNKTDPRKGRGGYIILSLLELIGGHLEAVSEPGRGTTFSVILPRQDEAPDNGPDG
ncbi:sensor histidine kinase [Taibaiella koreensis]|uniref:sensor histidine kinase n=1 Tax=Taibaiella koreensis TaxID=1268548 RepID=UPI000E59C629|nr:HAMP domain-containing sensor histidine kinase [Taibaiella koreensis]